MNTPIYFIRHTFKNAEAMQSHCIVEQAIAIHFNSEGKFSFEEYSLENQQNKGFKKAFRTLEQLGEQGGLVVAQYNPSEFYLGEVRPKTAIELYDYGQQKGTGENYYKLLKLSSRKGPYAYANYPHVMALKPPYTTINVLSKYANNIIVCLWNETTAFDCIVNNLHPKMLEQMCEEWLRTSFADDLQIRFQTFQTGKNLPIVDILAETLKGERLAVQVTHTKDVKKAVHKAKALLNYQQSVSSDNKLRPVFMGPKSLEVAFSNNDLELTFKATEEIFDDLKADPHYERMLKQMIGIC
jgi:hypothetical protein